MLRAAVVTEPQVGSVVYLDPRGNVHSVDRQMSRRLGHVTGAVAALLDNGNDTSRFFLEGLAAELERSLRGEQGDFDDEVHVDEACRERTHPAHGSRGGLPGGWRGAVRVLHVEQYA
jgi:hypothetical protein